MMLSKWISFSEGSPASTDRLGRACFDPSLLGHQHSSKCLLLNALWVPRRVLTAALTCRPELIVNPLK